jgi:hypothetical protein
VPATPAVFGADGFRIQPVKLPPTEFYPDLRSSICDDQVRQAEAALAKSQSDLVKATQGAAASPAAADAVLLAAKSVLAAEARRASLQARIAAETARYANVATTRAQSSGGAAPGVAELARQAAAAERRAELAAAEEDLLRQEQAAGRPPASEQNSKKPPADAQQKIAAARTRLVEAAKALASPGEKYAALGPAYPDQSTGRRLALARWIARPENPLTARVAVNHIWMRHFGQPLVSTVFDFGANGKPPTHPALLDWLAVELMQPSIASPATTTTTTTQSPASSSAPWSMKHLHRLIVTSSAYQLASTSDAASRSIDPDNHFLWQWTPRRMEAEAVRDGVLYVAGQLDLSTGGPDIDHALGLVSRRRSLYFRHAPEKQMEFLKLFDVAAPTQCYERRESVMPQQALALANSQLALAQSRHLARKLSSGADRDVPSYVAALFEQVLSRGATAAEREACVDFVDRQTRFFVERQARSTAPANASQTTNPADVDNPSVDPALRARENLAHVLLNHADFVTIR